MPPKIIMHFGPYSSNEIEKIVTELEANEIKFTVNLSAEQAEQNIEMAHADFVAVGDQIGLAWSPYHRAVLARLRGDFTSATALANEALAAAVERPEGSLRLFALEELALISFWQGNHTQAISLAQQLYDAFSASGQAPLSLDGDL